MVLLTTLALCVLDEDDTSQPPREDPGSRGDGREGEQRHRNHRCSGDMRLGKVDEVLDRGRMEERFEHPCGKQRKGVVRRREDFLVGFSEPGNFHRAPPMDGHHPPAFRSDCIAR